MMTPTKPQSEMLMLIRVAVVLASVLFAPAVADAQTDTVYYFHTDAVGSVRMITDASGQEVARHDYLPFGEEWGSTSYSNVENRRKFAGLERDAETGFDYALARYYRQQSGRFTQADDPSFANPFAPQSAHLYTYVYNNPLKFVDPTGHTGDCIGQYNEKTNTCELWDLGLEHFLEFGEWYSRFRTTVESVRQFVTAPRSSPCMANWIGAGAARGLAVGTALGAATGGPTIVVTAPTAVAVNVAGGLAAGSVMCMSSAGGGGGGGGGHRDKTRGANARDREQIRSAARAAGVDHRKFGDYIETLKRKTGRAPSENFSYRELIELAQAFKRSGGR